MQEGGCLASLPHSFPVRVQSQVEVKTLIVPNRAAVYSSSTPNTC